VDYWGLLEPETAKKEWRFSNRGIGVALRRLASEFDIPLLTAWQANREGEKAYVLLPEHIGEDISVKQTSDIIITLNQTTGERDEKIMRMGVMKLRNSTKYPMATCRCNYDRMTIHDMDDAALQDIVDTLKLTEEENETEQQTGAGAGLGGGPSNQGDTADMAGAIILPDQAQLSPVSGIIVLPEEDAGRRAYFRPHTQVMVPMGYDPRRSPYVGIVHVRDILMLEDVAGE